MMVKNSTDGCLELHGDQVYITFIYLQSGLIISRIKKFHKSINSYIWFANWGLMVNFEHFLITRMNLGYIERSKSKGINPDIWLEKRMMLFFRNCIPSILAQSNFNFTWIIYLDRMTPKKYIDELKENLAVLKNVKLFFKFGHFNSIFIYVADDIRSLVSNQTTHLITSRVDSDDMLHRDYISKVQRLFSGQDYQPINFDLGYFYHNSKGVVGITKFECNSFITLIEKINEAKSFKTVWHKIHTAYCQDDKRLSIKEKPFLTCVSVHDLNDSTEFYVRPFLFRNIDLAEDFNFQYQVKANFSDRFLFFINYFKSAYIKRCNKIIRT